jgi:hypothetical protein
MATLKQNYLARMMEIEIAMKVAKSVLVYNEKTGIMSSRQTLMLAQRKLSDLIDDMQNGEASFFFQNQK